jgi:parallel beta-helix repeat protein
MLASQDTSLYLPQEWGISTTDGNREIIHSFTLEGLASGVYDGLTTDVMGGWNQSYHYVFSIGSSPFVPFELGNSDGNDIVTVSRIYPSSIALGCEIELSNTCEINDVNIIAFLPENAEFYSCTGSGIYDSNQHQVVWDLIDSLDANDANCFTLTVRVPNYALQGSTLTNTVQMYTGNYLIKIAVEDTNICCVDNVVYVDRDANGANNGLNWGSAYTNLQTALTAVSAGTHGCANQIWVAAGSYKPVESTVSGYQSKTFTLPDNFALMGHFAGNETSPDERNFADANNTTVLEGRIGTTASEAVYNIITATGVSNALIDGFTIRNSYTDNSYYGAVFLNDSDVSIVNCRFENNRQCGIYAYLYSYPDVYNCTFFNNTMGGVYNDSHCQPEVFYSIFDGNNVDNTQGLQIRSMCAATVENCVFRNHKDYGIYGTGNGSLNVSNSQFTNNHNGLSLNDIVTELTDCNIMNSTKYGFSGSSSNIEIENTTITNSTIQGLYTNNSNLTLKNSMINGSGECGLNSRSSDITLENVTITDSFQYGLQDSGSNITLNNTTITDSTIQGLYTNNSNLTLKNTLISNSTQHGIYLNNDSSAAIENSIVKNNRYGGIYASDSEFSISHSFVSGNSQNGIYAVGGCNPVVTNSIIRQNGYNGLRLADCPTISVTNCWINKNGTAHSTSNGCSGIYLENTTPIPLIRNNTIYNNWTYGIQGNQYADPNVRNCIIYGNVSGDLYRTSGSFSKVNYCCLQATHSGTDNFVADPMFTNSTDPNNLHLADGSPCINAGDPCGIYADETDIDNEPRNFGRVDVGGDETYYSNADYDDSGIVDFLDYHYLANDWQTGSSVYSLDDDNNIDGCDLALFYADWLWQYQTGLGWLDSMEEMFLQRSSENERVAMIAMAESESITADTSATTSDSLMITDVQTSKALRPKRLADRTNAFYAITPQSVAEWKAKTANISRASESSEMSLSSGLAMESAEVAESVETFDVNETLNWLDNLWQTDESIQELIDANDWQEFLDAIKSSQ